MVHRFLPAPSGCLLGILLALAPRFPDASALAAEAHLVLAPCRVPGVDETLRCGDLTVPENPRETGGRAIPIHVVVLPALDPKAHGDPPLFDLAGGPGVAGSSSAPFYATDGRMHRKTRDVVLVDQRGTGGSNPLHCEELEHAYLRDDMYPADMVARCRASLKERADLSQYTTQNAAEDLDRVRAALRASKIDIIGLSYGTRLALAYVRRHPTRVRAAALIGTVGDDKKLPLWHARYAQVVMDRLLADCASDPACRGAFPDVAKEWRNVLSTLEAGPITVKPATQGGVPVVVRRGLFGEAFRNLLVSTGSQLRVPRHIHEMNAGDWGPFLRSVLPKSAPIAEGLYLSTTCAEDTLRITPREREEATAGTFLGTYRVDQQTAACKVWDVPSTELPQAIHDPDVPVLFLAGSMDYVTPASWAREIAAGFRRARVVEIPAMGHFPDGLEKMACLDEMIAAFFAKGDAPGVDTSCVAGMKRPPFVLAPEAKPH